MNKDEIEARALELYPERKRQNKKGTGEYDANLPRRKAYIKGWTDAQPTLPEDSPLAPQVASGTCTNGEGNLPTKNIQAMAKIVFKGLKFSIHDNKNVTCNGKEITNEELERMLNKSNFKL